MFTRLAKFRPFERPRVIARWCKAVHSNDNLPGRRRPAGELRSPPPALTCHWSISCSDGRLECRWEAAELGKIPADPASSHRTVTQKLEAMSFVAHRSLAAVGA